MGHSPYLQDWVSSLAAEIYAEGGINNLQNNPLLKRITSEFDEREYQIFSKDNNEPATTNINKNNKIFQHTIKGFGYKVIIPLHNQRENENNNNGSEKWMMRRCFLSLMKYAEIKRRRRDYLIKALHSWRLTNLRTCFSIWKLYMANQKILLVKNYFLEWRKYILNKKRLDILQQKVMKWREKKEKKKYFIKWKRYLLDSRRERRRQFFIEHRHNLLVLSHCFEGWLQSFQRVRIVRRVKERDNERLLSRHFKQWKLATQQSKMKRMRMKQAKTYYEYSKVVKIFSIWRDFAHYSINKKSVARRAVLMWMQKYCFQKWRFITRRNKQCEIMKSSVVQLHNLHQKQIYMNKWRNSLLVTRARLDSLIHFVLSRHFRRWRVYCKLVKQNRELHKKAVTFFIHKKFQHWRIESRNRKMLRTAEYYFSLRFFRRWYNAVYERHLMKSLSIKATHFYVQFVAPRVVKKHFSFWKRYIAYRVFKKKLHHEASLYYLKYTLPKRARNCFIAWRRHTFTQKIRHMNDVVMLQAWNKIKLKSIFDKFVSAVILRRQQQEHKYRIKVRLHGYLKRKQALLIQNIFRKWRAHVISVVYYKHSIATVQYNKAVLGKCFLAWTKYTRQRIMGAVAARVHSIRYLNAFFLLWKKAFTERKIKWRIAELYSKRRILGMVFVRLKRYHEMVQQATELQIYPLIQQRNVNLLSNSFGRWTKYVKNIFIKREYTLQALQFWEYHQLAKYFRIWKDFWKQSKKPQATKILWKNNKRRSLK